MSKSTFVWPGGKRAALSLSFDDARPSQVEFGLPLLARYGVRATFYVLPGNVVKNSEGWRAAVEAGHEIGNHTLTHPCSGDLAFSRHNALQDYTLERIEAELIGANGAIEELLDVVPRTFAYPCGQSFVGRGPEQQSYIPLVARHFLAARIGGRQAENDPTSCDLAEISCLGADEKPFELLQPKLEQAIKNGGWIVLCGHEIGGSAFQTVPQETLEAICRYARDEKNGLWLDTVEAVAKHVIQGRGVQAVEKPITNI